jgi:anaerobic ribonucleoside-triphosphate reductase activating protein
MRDALTLNVARWIARSRVNGPGERFVLWLQGCSLRCPGCWNADTWSHAPRRMMTTLEVLALIGDDVEGVTLTGGEPFEQADALVPLLDAVRARGLSVMVFTGHELDELTRDAATAMRDRCDVLVSGRYVATQRSLDLAWRGSSNQQVHFLTGRYDARDMPASSEAEVHLAPDGSLQITGFPSDELLALGLRGGPVVDP